MAERTKTTNWWYVGGGVILLLCGAAALLAPHIFLAYLTVFAGLGFLLSCFAGLMSYRSAQRVKGSTGTTILMAVLDGILGVLLMAYPFAFEAVIPWLLGVGFIAFGVMEIVGVMPFTRFASDSRTIMVIAGILAIVVGVMFIVWPASLSIWIAAFALVRGITLIAVGFTAR